MQQDQDVKRQRQGPANLERVGAERESDLKTVLDLIYRWRNLAVTSLFCNDEGLAVKVIDPTVYLIMSGTVACGLRWRV